MNSFLLFIGGASFGAAATFVMVAKWAVDKTNESSKEEPGEPAQ